MTILETFLSAALVAPDPAQIQLAADNQAEALRQKKPEAALIAKSWRAERLAEMRSRSQASADKLEEVLYRAVAKSELCGDFEVRVLLAGQKEPQIVPVRDLLSSPEIFDGCLTLDPLEPEYDGHRPVGKLYLDGTPRLHSMARGGRTYRLYPRLEDAGLSPITLLWDEGKSAEIVSRCIGQLEDDGRFYAAGDAACRIQGARMDVLTDSLLDFELSRRIKFLKHGRGGETKPASLPLRQVKQVLGQAASQLPPLEAIVDYPLPRPDGSLIDQRGYDCITGLFLRQDPDLFPVPASPSPQEISRAVEICLAPFAQYRFPSDAEGRSAVLAAVMTAVLRPALPVAPLIAISSPSLGAGKSYLAAALGAIAMGEIPGSHSFPESATELQKLLFSHLLDGSRIVNIDNVDRALHSNELSSFVTSHRYVGRILGSSAVSTRLPNRALVVMNGLNLSFGDGLSRRHIPLRLSAVGADALTRAFDFTPPELALQTRDEIITAVLTLTRVQADGHVRERSFGSFEAWSRLVREPIAMLARTHDDLGLIDPLDFLSAGVRSDVQTDSRGELLDYLSTLGLADEFTSTALRTVCARDGVWEDLVRSVFPHSTPSTPRGIGSVLSRIVDQPANGLVLRARKRDGMNLWRIDRHGALA